MSAASRRSGFTLVEVVVSVALLSVGIVGVLTGFSAVSRSEVRIRTIERVQRLAVLKYEELVATEQFDTAELSGDFEDVGERGVRWTATVEPSGVENLETLTVTVELENAPSNTPVGVMEGLVFNPPLTTGGTL